MEISLEPSEAMSNSWIYETTRKIPKLVENFISFPILHQKAFKLTELPVFSSLRHKIEGRRRRSEEN